MTTLTHCRQLLASLKSSLATLQTETADQGDREAISDAKSLCDEIGMCLDDVNHAGKCTPN